MSDNPFESQVATVPARIFWTLIGISLSAVACILGVALWMSGAANRLAAENAQHMIANALASERSRVEISTADYAYWTEAHNWLTARDAEMLFANLGSGATDSDTFDVMYLLDADGTALFAYESGGEGSDLSVFEPEVADAMRAALTDIPLLPFKTITAFARVRDQIAVIGAGRVQPDDISDLTTDDLGVFVGGVFLSDDTVAELGERLLLDGLVIELPDAALADGADGAILQDINGAPIAQLSWPRPEPGNDLFRTTVPLVLGLSVVLLGASALIGRTSARQTAAFLRERNIARTDQLTGLINRNGLEEIIASPQLAAALAESRAALLYLDLNGFKALNDTFGHDAGDLALRITAERLQRAVRHSDYVARVGGDEFVYLVIDDEPQKTAERIAARIISHTRPPIKIGRVGHHVRPSIGIALSAPGLSWKDLLSRADIAMYQGKRNGLLQPVLHVDGMSRDISQAKTRSAVA